jgi:O-antigen/teichoic acid export membrane protein
MTVRKALLFSYAEKYSTLLITIVSSMVLARLLTPAEIGVYSVGAVFVGLAATVRDLGAGTYVVQEPELTGRRIRATFTVALLVGAVLAAALALLAAPMAAFYREPGVRAVILVLALNFLVVPFGSVTQALLTRNLRFDALARVRIASTLVNALAGIALAALGFGFMSLAFAALASSLASALITWLYRPKNLSYLPEVTEIRRVLSFGGRVSASSLVNELGKGAPDLIIARVLGFAPTGLYGRAAGLTSLFQSAVMRAIWPVALPYFADRHRAGDDLKARYLASLACITGIGWPFFAFLALMAYPAVRILYGPQWDGSVPVVRVLCGAEALALTFSLSGSLFTAIGAVRQNLTTQLTVQPLKIALILFAAFHGLSAVAFALAAAALVHGAMVHYYMRRLVGVRLSDYAPVFLRSGGLALAAAVAPLAVTGGMTIGPDRLWGPLLIAAAGAALGFAAGLLVLNHPLRREAFALVRLR